jgi:hypothetical protein
MKKGNKWLVVAIFIVLLVIVSLIVVSLFLPKKENHPLPPYYPQPPINPPDIPSRYVQCDNQIKQGMIFKDDYESWTDDNQNNWSGNYLGGGNALLQSSGCYQGKQCILLASSSDDNYPQFSSCYQFPTGNYIYVTYINLKCNSGRNVIATNWPASQPGSNNYRCYFTFSNDGSISGPKPTSGVLENVGCNTWFKFMINTTDDGRVGIWINDIYKGEYFCDDFPALLSNGIVIGGVGEIMLDNTAVCSDTSVDCYNLTFGQ